MDIEISYQLPVAWSREPVTINYLRPQTPGLHAMKQILTTLVLACSLLASCSNQQSLENKVWKLVNVNSSSTAAFLNHMEGELSNAGGYSRFLRFYNDGTYTAKLGETFDYGTWEASGKTLTMHSHDK